MELDANTLAGTIINIPWQDHPESILQKLMIIPGAVHTDLYDNTDIIPFEKMVKFFQTNLN